MEARHVIGALGALAQETRLAIYRKLVEHGHAGLAAGRIGAALKLAPATLSFHLRELSRAGLICARQQSRFIYYSADFPAMDTLLGYLAENCCRPGAVRTPADGSPTAPQSFAFASSVPKPVVHPKHRVA